MTGAHREPSRKAEISKLTDAERCTTRSVESETPTVTCRRVGTRGATARGTERANEK